ncbi:MAG: hypothetical protein ABIK73_06780 [candidate division WOR-3 bacterium]
MDITALIQQFIPAAIMVYYSTCATTVVAITQIIKNITSSLGYKIHGFLAFLTSLIVSCLVILATFAKLQPDLAIPVWQYIVSIIIVCGIANGFWKVAKHFSGQL